uniref:Ig-like domain-containing protein n=1 Tax=Laticauda laticaudata TaxID=8630 RepID=A0A8C5SNW8_LATLA
RLWSPWYSLSLVICLQVGLIQPASQSAALGNNIRLACYLMTGYEDYAVSWYQQRAGQAPRLVLTPSYSRGEGVPNRFSGSKTGNKCYLTITQVQAEDEATYYCSMYYGRGLD